MQILAKNGCGLKNDGYGTTLGFPTLEEFILPFIYVAKLILFQLFLK